MRRFAAAITIPVTNVKMQENSKMSRTRLIIGYAPHTQSLLSAAGLNHSLSLAEKGDRCLKFGQRPSGVSLHPTRLAARSIKCPTRAVSND